jgi:hypothetical protein
MTEASVIRQEFYKKSLDIVNSYFDIKLKKKSFFTPASSIESARNEELLKLEQRFFKRIKHS